MVARLEKQLGNPIGASKGTFTNTCFKEPGGAFAVVSTDNASFVEVINMVDKVWASTGECVGRDPGLSDALYGLLKLCAPFHPKMSSLLGAFLELGDDLGKDTTRDWAQISAATIQSTYEQIEKVKETCSTLGNLSKSTLRGR